MLHQHLFSLTVVAVLVSLSWDSSTQVLKPFCGRLQINLSGDSSNLGSFTNWRIDEHYFRGDHYYYWLKCDYSFGWKSSLRWDEQRWKSSFWSHLYQLVPVHWTTHQRFFSLSMGMIRYFSLRKMANPLLGIVIIHFPLYLMISSSLPSVGTSTRFWGILPQFRSHSIWGLPTRSQTRWWNLICFRYL